MRELMFRRWKAVARIPRGHIPWLAVTCLLLPTTTLVANDMTRTERVQQAFNQLRADNLQILDSVYAPDVRFVDPLGEHRGLPAVKGYYAGIYRNVEEIHFEFQDAVSGGNTLVLAWRMDLRASGLKGGDLVQVDGISHIRFNADHLIDYHRDYFDMGQFVYEHVPVLGWAVRRVKKRLGSQ